MVGTGEVGKLEKFLSFWKRVALSSVPATQGARRAVAYTRDFTGKFQGLVWDYFHVGMQASVAPLLAARQFSSGIWPLAALPFGVRD